MSMKDLLNKMSQLEALPAPKTRQVLNESAPVATTTSKRSLKDVFNELHENIPPNTTPIPVVGKQGDTQKTGVAFLTSKDATLQGMLSKLGPNDVQIVQASGQAPSGQSQPTAAGQPNPNQMQNPSNQTMQEEEFDGAHTGADGKSKPRDAPGRRLSGLTADERAELAALEQEARESVAREIKYWRRLGDLFQGAAPEESQAFYARADELERSPWGKNLGEEEEFDEAHTGDQAEEKFEKYNAKELDYMLKKMRGTSEQGDAHRQMRARQAKNAAYNIMWQKKHSAQPSDGNLKEGANVDRMVKRIEQSEKKSGKSKDEAEDIAWATANKRGMLNNKNKKKVKEGDIPSSSSDRGAGLGAGRNPRTLEGKRSVTEMDNKYGQSAPPNSLRSVTEFIEKVIATHKLKAAEEIAAKDHATARIRMEIIKDLEQSLSERRKKKISEAGQKYTDPHGIDNPYVFGDDEDISIILNPPEDYRMRSGLWYNLWAYKQAGVKTAPFYFKYRGQLYKLDPSEKVNDLESAKPVPIPDPGSNEFTPNIRAQAISAQGGGPKGDLSEGRKKKKKISEAGNVNLSKIKSRDELRQIIARQKETLDLKKDVRGTYDLSYLDLSGLDLSQIFTKDVAGRRLMNLSGTHFINSNLTGVYLVSAILSEANLTGADLTGADLTAAVLTGAILSGANVEETNFTAADLVGTIRNGIKNSDKAINAAVSLSENKDPKEIAKEIARDIDSAEWNLRQAARTATGRTYVPPVSATPPKKSASKPAFPNRTAGGIKNESMKKAPADKKKKKVDESMNHRISAARLEGKSHGLRGHAHSGKRYEDPDEMKAYHDGYKDGMDQLHEMGMYENAPATVPGMAQDDLNTPLDEMYDEMEEDALGEMGRLAYIKQQANKPGDTFDAFGQTFHDKDVLKDAVDLSRLRQPYDMDRMSQLSKEGEKLLVQLIRTGDEDILFKVMDTPKTPAQDSASDFMHALFDDIAEDTNLDRDADVDEIFDQMMNQLSELFRGDIPFTASNSGPANKSSDEFGENLYSSRKHKDVLEGDFAFEAWDRQLNSLINEGLSVSISKGNQNSPDSVNVNATDSEADKLLSLVKQAGMGIFGGDDGSDYGSPEMGGRSEINSPGGIEVVGDHDGMLGLMKKLSGIQDSASSDYEEEDYECDEKEENVSEVRCDECGMMESKCGGHDEALDEVESPDQMAARVAEGGAQNPPDSGAANATNDEQGNAAANQALATADLGQDVEDGMKGQAVQEDDDDEDPELEESFTFESIYKKLAFLESTENEDAMAEEKVTKDKKGMSEKQAKFFGEKKEKVDEWANQIGKGPGKGTDASFEQDIEFMTKVISGGLNKPKSTGQTTVPVVASQHDRLTSHNTTSINESISDWKKLAGIK